MLNISEGKLGWAAGILDGEGSLTIAKDKRGEWYSPRIGVGNTDRAMLHTLQALLGGSVYDPKRVRGSDKRVVVSKKKLFLWYIDKPLDIVEILISVFPYLVTKKERAGILIKFCFDKVSRVGVSDYGAESYYQRMKELNR